MAVVPPPTNGSRTRSDSFVYRRISARGTCGAQLPRYCESWFAHVPRRGKDHIEDLGTANSSAFGSSRFTLTRTGACASVPFKALTITDQLNVRLNSHMIFLSDQPASRRRRKTSTHSSQISG